MNTSIQSALYDQVRVAIHKQWDPIGVSVYSDEMGEYDGYIPELCKLIENKADREVVIEYLWSVETIAMGLSGDRPHTEKFADQLLSL
ncbi:hypothetical protein PSCICO_25350 [Pseudomonas cichorii]|uniref:DUF1871 family protein n=1 Tax=Pseudomonas cichorii TaxID=36746 RepID=A0ABQ1DLP9_PSECI|nr:hypothetical protein PSCICM_30280 [Pseudomonas cichorii]GFM87136.1 hypothetical protein PSCICO_25350 [Pseudomonas cichorii]GFM91942.1 hypothetical protein PSCICP_19140 [Pseudomonas cichorii]SDN76729.1 hypothetical protein SAMN05216599_103244 [Pseudomonas cichorii]